MLKPETPAFRLCDLVHMHPYRQASILPPLSRRCGSGPTLIRGLGGYPSRTISYRLI